MSKLSPSCAAQRTMISRSDHAAAARSWCRLRGLNSRPSVYQIDGRFSDLGYLTSGCALSCVVNAPIGAIQGHKHVVLRCRTNGQGASRCCVALGRGTSPRFHYLKKANAQGSPSARSPLISSAGGVVPLPLAGLPVDLIRAPVPGYYGFTVSRVSGMMETKRVGGVP